MSLCGVWKLKYSFILFILVFLVLVILFQFLLFRLWVPTTIPMSYIRSTKFQSDRLEVLASISWTKMVLFILKQRRHYFSDHVCLRVLRTKLGDHLMHSLPRVIRENLFQPGCLSLRRELWSPLRNFLDPHMFVPFMYVLYNTDIKQLEVPPLIKVQDRLTVLDMLYNLGTPHGHQAQTLKLKMCETQPISIEESYMVKRVLRSFRSLRTLLLWKVLFLYILVFGL